MDAQTGYLYLKEENSITCYDTPDEWYIYTETVFKSYGLSCAFIVTKKGTRMIDGESFNGLFIKIILDRFFSAIRNHHFPYKNQNAV